MKGDDLLISLGFFGEPKPLEGFEAKPPSFSSSPPRHIEKREAAVCLPCNTRGGGKSSFSACPSSFSPCACLSSSLESSLTTSTSSSTSSSSSCTADLRRSLEGSS